MTDFALVLLFSFVATFAIAYFIGRRDRKKYQAKPSCRGTYAQAYGRTHRTGQTDRSPEAQSSSTDDGFLSGYLTHSLLTSDDSCSSPHDSGSSSDSCGGESSCGGGGD